MKTYKIEVSEAAEHDLRDIMRYISAQLSAPITAMGLIEILEGAMYGLANMPKGYPLVSDERLAFLGYRKLVVKNYIIFFTIEEKESTVNIERILYAKRQWRMFL